MATLVSFWQQEHDVYAAAQTAAQADLAAAQATLAAAMTALDSDVTALSKLTADIAANRAKLSTTSVPSEVTALNLVIRDQLIQQRGLQGAILDSQDTVAWARADADAAAALLARANTRLAD